MQKIKKQFEKLLEKKVYGIALKNIEIISQVIPEWE